MKITLIQTAPVWGNPAASRSAAEALLERADAGTDLIVFPEMFSTGFISEPEGVAEPGGGDTLPWMRRVAAERDCAVAGSVAVDAGGRFVNRFFFVFPDGTVRHYDKRHLFSYGSEHLHFTAGEERVVVSWRGVRILLSGIAGQTDHGTAGAHGLQEQVGVAHAEQKDHAGRRLLKKLQRRILGVEVHELGFFDDVRLALCLVRQNLRIDRQVPDLGDGQFTPEVPALVGEAPEGKDVGMNTRGSFPAAAAFSAGDVMPVQTDGGGSNLPGPGEGFLP